MYLAAAIIFMALWWILAARLDILNKIILKLEDWQNRLNEYKRRINRD